MRRDDTSIPGPSEFPSTAWSRIADVIRRDFLARAESKRGSFRAFLKASLEIFRSTTHRDATTEKRGGGEVYIRMDDAGGHVAAPNGTSASSGSPSSSAIRESPGNRGRCVELLHPLTASGTVVNHPPFADLQPR